MKLSTLTAGAVLSLLSVVVPAPCVAAPSDANTTRSTQPPAPTPGVTFRAALDHTRYSPGQPIQVRLTATNTSNRQVQLRFTSGQRFDIWIYPQGQRESVYTWSATRMFIQALGTLTLKPGQSEHFDASIGDEMGQLRPGKYRLVAALTSSPRRITAAPVTFEVVNLNLTMTARTNKTRYRIGEAVQINMAVTNRARRLNRVPFDSGLTFDVFITDESENPVWNYGANLRFIRPLGEVTWQRGETKTYSAQWDGVALPGENPAARLAPGRYRVQAVLQSTPRVYAAPIYIDIVS